jgi:hypothetical protein
MARALILLIAFVLAAPVGRAQTRADNGTINIMRPEGSAPAKHRAKKKAHEKKAGQHKKARRAIGSSNPVYPAPLPPPQKPYAVPRYSVPAPRRVETPPPLFVPQTSRTLPNLPQHERGLGPGGTESFQQRAARCHQQAGIYGPNATGSPSAYINSCINQ